MMSPKRPRFWSVIPAAIFGLLVAARGTPIGAPLVDSGPGVRNAHGLAFDGRIAVLFGGADERGLVSDTWGWDGARWRRFEVSGPPARTFPVMVGTDSSALLFGGRRVLFGTGLEPSQLLDDLWRWNGQGWSRLHSRGPSGRAEAAAAWDPKRHRLVMFGGYRASDGEVERLGDTWELGADGQWQLVATTGPEPRYGAMAVYDATRSEVVLFGGSGALADTWAWNGARWRRVGADVPGGRYNAAGSSGAGALSPVRVGGWDGSRRRRDTWWFVGDEWRPGPDRGPSARNHAAMTFDAPRGRHVLFGGHDGSRVFGDLWELDRDRWRLVYQVPARRRLDNRH